MSDTGSSLRAALVSRGGQAVAVTGMASRAIVYLALAALIVQLAAGDRRGNTDQGSALASLGRVDGGQLLLVVFTVGVVCYVVWRWSIAWLGSSEQDADDRTLRIFAFLEGLGYLPFAYLAVAVLAGDPGRADQGAQYRTLSAQVLRHGIGQVLVGAVGVAVVVVGGFFVYQGWARTFADHFDFPQGRPAVRRVVLLLGVVGSIARGIVFVVAGGLVIYAAATVDPKAAGGLDAALDTLRHQPFGTWLLVLSASGFAAFALFALAEAVWRERD